ncbi:MAG: response regulator [Desulfocapsaceae bacterium]|nr:response regulator [Desulfocapsaceae bacterium]
MKTALIIEDNPDNMVLIMRLLEKAGYKTIQAITGMEGVEMAVHNAPDFIILDIQLPDIDGREVLVRIRSFEVAASIPIIAMTSYAMSGDREKLLAAGCDGYIEKPIDPMRVISQIQQVTGGAEQA